MNSQKKIKLIISSLKDKELIKFFQGYINCFSSHFNKSIRQISFNCFQSVCQFQSKVVNGYGKNSSEAFVNGVRNLIDLLLEDEKNQSIMKQMLKKFNTNFESQKKLLATQKTFKTINQNKPQDKASFAMSTNFTYSKKNDNKDKSIKQQICQYFNLQNLKIANPNSTNKSKTHEKYLNSTSIQNQEQEQLKITLLKIKQVQRQISQANTQNKKLREKLNQYYKKDKQNRMSDISSKSKPSAHSSINPKYLKQHSPKTNNFINYSSTNGNQNQNQDKAKLRSISVDPAQKYYTPYNNTHTQQNDEIHKKIKIPKLNLQVLPNYHGKSNKSLNQSLLEGYQKIKK